VRPRLAKAETLARLPKLARGGFHPFRRLWASERRHLPAQDVAAAGGWRSLEVLRHAYQHADAAGMMSVVESPRTAPDPESSVVEPDKVAQRGLALKCTVCETAPSQRPNAGETRSIGMEIGSTGVCIALGIAFMLVGVYFLAVAPLDY